MERTTISPPWALMTSRTSGSPSPVPGMPAFSAVARTEEPIEDRIDLRGRDANARIRDLDDCAPVVRRYPNTHIPTLRRELDGVGDQVQERPLELTPIADSEDVLAGKRECNPLPGRNWFHRPHGRSHHFPEVEVFGMTGTPIFGSPQRRQVVDQFQQEVGRSIDIPECGHRLDGKVTECPAQQQIEVADHAGA